MLYNINMKSVISATLNSYAVSRILFYYKEKGSSVVALILRLELKFFYFMNNIRLDKMDIHILHFAIHDSRNGVIRQFFKDVTTLIYSGLISINSDSKNIEETLTR